MKSGLIVAAFAAVLAAGGAAAPALADAGHDHAAAVQTAEGEGVIKAVDAKAGSVTLRHGPIAALKWPAMTMAFRVETPALLDGLSVGQKVRFTLKNENGKPVVSEIRPL